MFGHSDGAYRAADLGLDVWDAEGLGPPEIVALQDFSGHFVLHTIPYHQEEIRVTMSLCHVSVAFSLLSCCVHMIF